MHDPVRRPGRPAPLIAPLVSSSRRPSRVLPPSDPYLGIGEEPGRVPGIRLREIHTAASRKACSACGEDFSSPELSYRVVLRCATAGTDH
jgi:hypothetical protein